MRKIYFLLPLLMIISSGLYAQIENPVKWSYAAKKMNQQEAVVFIKATIDENWHIYSINQKPGGPLKTSLVFIPSTGYQLEGKLREPTPHTVHDEVFDMEVSYFEKSVVFQQKVKLNTGQAVVKGKIKYMVCNEEKCVTPDDVDFSIPVK